MRVARVAGPIVATLAIVGGTLAGGGGAGADPPRGPDRPAEASSQLDFLTRTPPEYALGHNLVQGLAAPAVRERPEPPARTDPVIRTLTYSISVQGVVHSDLRTFTDTVASTYADARGWAGAGLEFVRVPAGGDFTVVLTQAALMPSYGPDCDPRWSCREGRFVAINDDRFDGGSPFWPGPVAEYRHMVINHETGHWLGFGHEGCNGAGQLAPLMMQQSKGVAACTPNPWPLPSELARERVAAATGTVPAAPDLT